VTSRQNITFFGHIVGRLLGGQCGVTSRHFCPISWGRCVGGWIAICHIAICHIAICHIAICHIAICHIAIWYTQLGHTVGRLVGGQCGVTSRQNIAFFGTHSR
jgi:hypothetical protein